MTLSETTSEGNQAVESSNATSTEVLELKKKLAEEFVSKNFGSASAIKKGAIENYLVDKNTPMDTFIDNVVIKGLGKALGLLPQDIEEYRKMFSAAETKDELENLRNNIFNETGGTNPASTTTHVSNTPSESPDTMDNSGIVKKACKMAVDIANNDSYGYERGGTGNNNGRKGFDCQSFVRHCYIKAGINVPPSGGCGTMKGDFKKVGFECITFHKNDELKPGDILVDPISKPNKSAHTEMCVGENQIAGAHGNKDGRAGDSGGKEISIRSVKSSLSYWSPQFILRYKG